MPTSGSNCQIIFRNQETGVRSDLREEYHLFLILLFKVQYLHVFNNTVELIIDIHYVTQNVSPTNLRRNRITFTRVNKILEESKLK